MGMYNTPFGQSEISGMTRVNNMGQKVYTSGGVYDSKGNPITLTPINNTTLPGWYKPVTTTAQNKYSIPASAFVNTGGSSGGSSGGTVGSGGMTGAGGKAAEIYQQAIDTMKGGVSKAEDAVAQSNKHIASADADLVSARESAANITNAINNINNTAQSLSPYAEIFKNLGIGTAGIGTSILAGDTSGGGLAAQFLNAVGMAGDAALKINPDRYVSQAAGDVQSSFDNAYGQMIRNAERTGVTGGSGNMAALQNQYAQSLATALAAARTRARQTGLNEQVNALTQRAGLFKDAISTGAALQEQGAGSVAKAAGIVQSQGDLFATAGSLGGTQSNAFANIGGVEVNLGQLELKNNEAVQDALAKVAAAQQAMADYYAQYEIATLPTTTTEKTSGWSGGKYTSNKATSTQQKG